MPDFRRKNIRLQNFDYKNGYAYFVTINTANNIAYFLNTDLAKFVESTIDYRIHLGEVIIYCYCIMPNHIHILLSLKESYTNNLSAWVSSFKKFISKAVKDKFNIHQLCRKIIM